MSDTPETGVLYTEYAELKATLPGVGSLWSYETCPHGGDRRRIRLNRDGSQEYWLGHSDPLLNTILPGTAVSLIVNSGDLWAAGLSLSTSAFLPRVCVVGPFTRARILRVGRSVRAVGACLLSTLTPGVFGVPASELIDRVVPLQELWTADEVERLYASFSQREISRCVSFLRDELESRAALADSQQTIGRIAAGLMRLHGGRVSIAGLARDHGLSRREFGRRFCEAAGLPPKLFARITRFQALVHHLLATDVTEWASTSSAVGFYDQAHMINEFRAFAGSPPTVFFRPHAGDIDPTRIQLRGRPCEWLQPMVLTADEHLAR